MTRTDAFASLATGALSAVVAIAMVWALATDPLIPRRLTCAVKTADGCMVWVDKNRAERFKNAKAGS